jgi:hypothetical protein
MGYKQSKSVFVCYYIFDVFRFLFFIRRQQSVHFFFFVKIFDVVSLNSKKCGYGSTVGVRYSKIYSTTGTRGIYHSRTVLYIVALVW